MFKEKSLKKLKYFTKKLLIEQIFFMRLTQLLTMGVGGQQIKF